MSFHRTATRIVAVSCLTAGLVIGSSAVATATPGTAAPAPRVTATATALAPVDTLHIAPGAALGGRGVVGATVTVTDARGVERTTTIDPGRWWFVPIADLAPVLSVTQAIDGQVSEPVLWGEPASEALAPVENLHIGPGGRLGGSGAVDAVITVTDRSGAVRTTSTPSQHGFWFVDTYDLTPGYSVTQTKGGVTSAPVTFG